MPSDKDWDGADYEDMIDFLAESEALWDSTYTGPVDPTDIPFKGEGWTEEFNWEDEDRA